jgi:hypothetical protein
VHYINEKTQLAIAFQSISMEATSSDYRNTQGQVAEQQSRDQPIVDKRTLEG